MRSHIVLIPSKQDRGDPVWLLYARGDAEPGSDIDVLILVDASRQDISARNWQIGNLAAELLLDYGIVVPPIVENRDYFNKNVDILPFHCNVERKGVRLDA